MRETFAKEARPGRAPRLMAIGRLFLRIPLASCLTITVWTAAVASHSVAAGPPAAIRNAVAPSLSTAGQGDFRALFLSIFFTGSLASYLLASAVILAAVGFAESTMGRWRTAAAFLGGHFGALVLYLAAVEAGSALGSDWLASMKRAVVMGPYAGALAAAMAASPLVSALWRRRLRSVAVAVTLMLLLYVGHPITLVAFLGLLCGLVLGQVMHRNTARASRLSAHFARSSSRETRALLSMTVAVFAAGPAMAALAQAPSGPLAVLRDLIVNPVPTIGQLQANCPAAIDLSCAQVVHSPGLNGPGGVALSVVPFLMLLVCAEGLRRGHRLALWLTIGVHVVIAVLSALHLQLFSLFGTYMRTGGRVLSVDSAIVEVLPVVLVPFVIAALLFVSRRHFIVDPDPVLRHRTQVLLPSLFAVFVLGYVIAWFAEDNYHRRAGLLALLTTLPRMFLPYPFSFRYSVSVYPHGFFSTLLFSFGGAIYWLVAMMSVLGLFLSRRLRETRQEFEQALAKELVRMGGGSLSWMALWPNNRYWFNDAGTAGIAYQVHFNVAVTVGGPFGSPADAYAAAEEFTRFCAAHSLAPCWYSVADDQWEHLGRLGYRRVAVAEETLLPIRELEFRGKEWQNVRTAINKARKLGIAALWSTYGELTGSLRAQVHEISEAWVADKALPEMGFTLGSLEELKDDEVLLCLAVDTQGTVHGVTSWLPVFAGGRVVSRTLDFMRRSRGSFPGVMEFLIASAVIHFKETLDVISLSGSPLVKAGTASSGPAGSRTPGPGPAAGAATAATEGDVLGRFLNLLGSGLEPVYGFRSLAAFKARFQPRHRTLYMMYQDPLWLPRIGRAVTEAYMPNISFRQTAKLVREIVG
ncbi:bifunctional lysylphosphatidylglycerol flippase/synthetase MprF [Arthrobacter sp. NPDC056727]|uniref:bifunctional lysylphosphatidylglycerol flippase/synthetase MprF n=1 Tax=Arthrobacter sp. NPDC056727 TaxID=3345927 RepID=UPI00366C1519